MTDFLALFSAQCNAGRRPRTSGSSAVVTGLQPAPVKGLRGKRTKLHERDDHPIEAFTRGGIAHEVKDTTDGGQVVEVKITTADGVSHFIRGSDRCDRHKAKLDGGFAADEKKLQTDLSKYK